MEEIQMIKPESLYLALYVALADNRLFDREWYLIESLLDSMRDKERIQENLLMIVKDLPDKISLDEVIDMHMGDSSEYRLFSLKFAFETAYADGIFHDKEIALFNQIRSKLKIDRRDFEKIRAEAKVQLEKDKDAEFEQRLSERYGFSMFSDKAYGNVIDQIKTVAKEDTNISLTLLQNNLKMYKGYPKLLSEKRADMGKVVKKLASDEARKSVYDFFDHLTQGVTDMLDDTEDSVNLLATQFANSSDCYTVSFMGRTKAGKSTLHSILMGGLNKDFIGKGSERTTRFNYVYDFHGLRVVDTPGIGAPGGQSDTEIAEDIADESDLICYVVTSDSIQETEFDFLKKLKNRNKPVLILLNKKDNFLRTPKRKEAFLNNPLKWYEQDGEDAIQGHIDRITTYMTQNYDFHNFRIIPVHLLAARMALEEQDEAIKQLYQKASRMDIFLEELKHMIQTYGVLQKSQTIYNASVYRAELYRGHMDDQAEVLSKLEELLTKEKEECVSKISDAGKKCRNDLITAIGSAYELYEADQVRTFSYEHQSADKKKIQKDWDKLLTNGELTKKVSSVCDRYVDKYQMVVQDALEYSSENIEFAFKQNSLLNLKIKSAFPTLELAQFAVSIVGTMIPFLIPSLWFVGIGILVADFIVGRVVKSRKVQLDERKGQIYDALVESLEKQKEDNLLELLKKYDSMTSQVEGSITSYYQSLIDNATAVGEYLGDIRECQKNLIEDLNSCYAERLVNFMTGHTVYDLSHAPLPPKLSVERTFRKELVIQNNLVYTMSRKHDLEELSEILQEKVTIIPEA